MGASTIFEECWHKVRRAGEHLESFRKESGRFLDDDAYSIFTEYDAEQRKYIWRLNILKSPLQTYWAGIIGDCVHNARSALNYLAWRLAGSDLSDKETLLPIYDRPDKFEASLWRLKRIHRDAVAEFRKLQPYARTDPENSNLWVLQELDAHDKHKLLAMTATHPMSLSVGVRAGFKEVTAATQVIFPKFRFEQNAIVAEALLPFPIMDDEVEVDGKFTFEIAFERGIISSAGDYPVFDSLREIIWTVEKTLRYFEGLLDANPHWLPPRP